MRRRILQVDRASEALLQTLEAAVEATPWIGQFGASATFGVGAPTDPYVRMCRAECMLALLILHVEDETVEFIDEERLEVLRDAPSDAQREAMRAAAGG